MSLPTLLSLIANDVKTVLLTDFAISGDYVSQSALPIQKAAAAGIATVTTSAAHGFAVGQVVTVLLDPSDTNFDGEQTILSVTSTTFTYATAGSVGATACRGSAGPTKTINVILDNPISEHFHDGNHTIEYKTRTLTMAVSDIATPNILAKDGTGDSILISGQRWYVIDWHSDGNPTLVGLHRVKLADKRIGVARG